MNIVVVGAGPAGLTAAICAAESGASVTLIDDNPSVGGQIWRGAPGVWPDRLAQADVTVLYSTRVIAVEGSRLSVEAAGAVSELAWEKLILATGSRELFLPFPGWTLPGVFGAGGLQALVKAGLPVAGKRIVVSGTGPLLLAVTAHLEAKGATVVAVAEQAPWSRLIPFAARLPLAKQWDALRLRHRAYAPSTWVTAASGAGKLERVTLRSAARTETIPCDYLAVGFGLIPNHELAQAVGANPNVFLAGEINGIGGVDLAKAEGAIAGYSAAERPDLAREYFGARDRGKRFAKRLAETFALRPELRSLAAPETLVCRCEDVSLSHIAQFGSWREAKLQTRCGMGPCQGRVCGPAVQFLFGWETTGPSTPVFPVPVGALIGPERTNHL